MIARPLHRAWRGFALLLMIMVLGCQAVVAGNVAVSLTAPTPPAEGTAVPDVAGIRLAYGVQSDRYATTVDLGRATSVALSGLTAGQTYYFAATAYDATGRDISHSTEVRYTLTASGDVVVSVLQFPLECAAANVRCVDDTPGATQEYAGIQAAVDAAGAGDIVLVFEGSYAGFLVGGSGTASAPLVIMANDSGVLITSPVSVNGEDDGIYLDDVNYVTIEGFMIQSTPYRCIAARGATPDAPMLGLTIRRNTCLGAQHEGFYLSEVSQSLIEYNTIAGSGADGQSLGHGLYLANAGSDHTVIRGNTISNMRTEDGAGIHMNGDESVGGDGIISGLTIEDNIIFDGQQNGLSMDGVQDSTIQNNLIYGMARSAIRGFQIDGAAGPRNLTVVNNTLVKNGHWGMKLSEDGGGHLVFNTILLDNTTGAIAVEHAANLASNYNIVADQFSNDNDSSTISLVTWQRNGNDANSLIAPLAVVFVNPDANDYHLRSGSLALNSGVSSFMGGSAPTHDVAGSPRPQGAAYDAGAYEETVAAPLPDDPTPPSVAMTARPEGALVKQDTALRLKAVASDNVGVTKVEFYVNGELKCTDTTPNDNAKYICRWRVPEGSGLTYQLQAKAYDAQNNVGLSNVITATSW